MYKINDTMDYEQDNYIDPELMDFTEDYPEYDSNDYFFGRLNNYILSQHYIERTTIHGIRDRFKKGNFYLDFNWKYSIYYELYQYLRVRHGREGVGIYLYIRYGKIYNVIWRD